MRESNMSRVVMRLLKPLHPVRIETGMVCSGVPDVNYSEGWIELKALEHWPKREDTPLRIPHFTPQQRIWVIRRLRAGGRVHVLLTVGQDWLLFSGHFAAERLGDAPRAELFASAVASWRGTPPAEDLIESLLA
jgi:hypothetical protein